ncbi:MAG: hypothetical protein KAS32_18125 [Candidatus Peribacteraceae bacterium]|nr:hypothetical protein [Candidatus Peribacteraceae bacterium]
MSVSDNTLNQLEQILKNRRRYIIKTDKNKRDLNAVDGTLQELAVFTATLVSDLKKQGILK